MRAKDLSFWKGLFQPVKELCLVQSFFDIIDMGEET